MLEKLNAPSGFFGIFLSALEVQVGRANVCVASELTGFVNCCAVSDRVRDRRFSK